MFPRKLDAPRASAFLFGARGTGKSTWLEANLPEATSYDLLDSALALELARDPSLLARQLAGASRGSWVVIDEIQKVPALLDEVHRLIEKQKLRFLLSGSSARKLRRGGANLLAGRAVQRTLGVARTSGTPGDRSDGSKTCARRPACSSSR